MFSRRCCRVFFKLNEDAKESIDKICSFESLRRVTHDSETEKVKIYDNVINNRSVTKKKNQKNNCRR